MLKINLIQLVFLGLISIPVYACNEVISIAYTGSEAGKLSVRLNGVSVIKDYSSESPGFMPTQFLLNQGNLISAELINQQDQSSATAWVEIFKGCQDDFPNSPGNNKNVLATLKFDAAGSQEQGFDMTTVPDYVYLSAPVSDGTDLLEAIKSLQEKARQHDVDGYLTFFEPMFKDMALRGGPPKTFIREIITDLLSDKNKLVDPSELTLRPVLGGRVFEVTDKNGKAPLQFVSTDKTEGFSQTIAQAMYWVRYQDTWKVLRQ